MIPVLQLTNRRQCSGPYKKITTADSVKVYLVLFEWITTRKEMLELDWVDVLATFLRMKEGISFMPRCKQMTSVCLPGDIILLAKAPHHLMLLGTGVLIEDPTRSCH